MKHRILLLLLLSSCQFTIGQGNIVKDTLYLDENKIEVSKDLVFKKCLSKVFYCRVIDYESMVIFNTYYKYFFGKLNERELNQYKSLLKSRMGVPVDSSATILINYSLKNSKTLEYRRRYSSRDKEKVNNFLKLDRSKVMKKKIKTFDYTKRYINSQKKCLRKLKHINDIIPIYMFSVQTENKLNNKAFTWVKDYQNIFLNKFFNNESSYKFMVLKPNGEYFLKNFKATPYDFGDSEVLELIKNRNWTSQQEKWTRRLIDLPPSRTYANVSDNFESLMINLSCY